VSVHARIVGTGLIGTSLGIALTRAGFRVTLTDPSPTAARLARDLAAGEIADAGAADAPDLVVVVG
jgi:prephenate dehydrogenase